MDRHAQWGVLLKCSAACGSASDKSNCILHSILCRLLSYS